MLHDLLVERLAPVRPAGAAYSIDRQADINDIRAALDDPAVVRAVAAVLVEQQRLIQKYPDGPPHSFESLKNGPPWMAVRSAAVGVWFLAGQEAAQQ
jgi:hypothetical protein